MNECKNCHEQEETSQGIIDIDENNLCEGCRERIEFTKIVEQDNLIYQDFDCSMNH